MGLLPTTPSITTVTEGIRLNNQSGFLGLVRSFKESFSKVWFNEHHTPQEIFTEFGTSGGSFFLAAQAAVQFIATFAQINGQTLEDYLAESDYTPPLAYTINNDGTVTITV